MLLDWLVPPLCVACRDAPCARRGDPLCGPCRAALPWLGPRVCPRCAQPRPCGRCPAARQAFSRAWAPLGYAGPVPALVNALKERGAVGLAGLMAAQLVATAPADLWPAGAVLVPVPADPWRRRRRGVDHAARLAAALAPRTGLVVAPLLARPGRRGRQAGRRRAERLRADPAEVQVRTGRAGPAAGRSPAVVLVDDVHTTGATLHACALALKASGVARVVAVTYARTLA